MLANNASNYNQKRVITTVLTLTLHRSDCDTRIGQHILQSCMGTCCGCHGNINAIVMTTHVVGLVQGYSGEREEREARFQALEDTKEGLIIELEQTKRRLADLEAAASDLDARTEDLARQRAEFEEGLGEQGKWL